VETLINYFLPSKGLSQRLDLFELRKRKLYISFCLVSLFAVITFTISHILGGKNFAGLINVVGSILFIGSLYFYKLSGYYTISTSIYLIGCMFIISAQHYLAPNYMQSNLMWFPLISLVAYFLLQRRYSVLMMFVCSGFALASHMVGEFYPIPGDDFNRADGYTVNILSIILSIFVGHIIGKFVSQEETSAMDQVESKNTELVELSESNTALLSILSHDLANHIQVAYGHGKRASSHEIESYELSRSIQKINSSLDSMKSIVDEVRGYTATKSGKIEIRLTPVDIVEAIEDSLKNFERQKFDKSLKINLLEDITRGTRVFAEPISIVNSVFNNLISNAIKFSESKGHIDIFVTDLGPKVSVVIRDYGVGIPDELLTNMFNPKISTSRTGTHGEKGTGLGLPILKMFMDKFGGEIDVSSSTRGISGTEFRLHFNKVTDDA